MSTGYYCLHISQTRDGITYHLKMTLTHHYLATLFSKILLEEHKAPKECILLTSHAWCQAKIKLIFKGGDTSNPEHFRLIALTSAVRKLFNKLIATCPEKFLQSNHLTDTRLQKGFLTNINGTMERIFAVSAILQNAMNLGLPLAQTFLDLKNTFGSISSWSMICYLTSGSLHKFVHQ